MSFAVPIKNSALRVTYEFGSMAERNGWFMEISVNDKFFLIIEKDNIQEFVIDFAPHVKDRYEERISVGDLSDIVSSSIQCYLSHDVSHFDYESLKLQ